MRKLLLFAVLLITFATTSSPGAEKIAAPVPKPQEAPAIDGTYVLNYTTVITSNAWGKGVNAAVVPVTRTVLRTTGASISKGEITIGGNYDGGFGDGGWGGPGYGGGITSTQTMTYTIDPKATPMTIDIFTIDTRNKKSKSLGIIEVTDERITISVAKPGAERPKNMEESEEVTLYYFKKAPPPPKVEFRIVAMTVGKEAEAEKELNKLAKEGYELVNSTNPASADPKTFPTTVHFILKRTTR